MYPSERAAVQAALERAVRDSTTAHEMERRVMASFGSEWLKEAKHIAATTKPVGWLDPLVVPKRVPLTDRARHALTLSPSHAVALIVLGLLIAALLFPPYYQQLPSGMVMHMGMHSLFAPTVPGRVDASLLAVELLGISLVGGLAVWIVRTREPA